ncbi:MAG: metallophosphoesterase [Candidatus Thorarchaeota archaeon]
MRLAVVSDSHDNKNNILKAVSIINNKQVDALIHCGDYVAPFVRLWFDNLNDNIKKHFYGVFGNNDGERLFLKKNLGQICTFVDKGNDLILELGGKRIFASHMPAEETIDALVKSKSFDIILSGHTHRAVNKKDENGVLIVNPGELCGYLTGKATFALIDIDELIAEIIEL